MTAAVSAFASRVGQQPGAGFEILWCAGVGVVGTSAADLAAETMSLRLLLDSLDAEPNLEGVPGCFFLASSAGGVYGGCQARPMTEETKPHPISDYGRAKLEQEAVVSAWSRKRPGIAVLIGRLANLYGPGQGLHKPQGLISHLSRCMILGVPAHIYVPLDTIRDYVFAEDAGKWVAAGLRRLATEAGGGRRNVVKIYASEREISIAGLIGVFRRIARRQLKVVVGIRSTRAQQPALLQLRSTVWPEEPTVVRTQLLEGVSRVYQDQLRLLQLGRLPLPPPLGHRTG
jgi:UDP-glucose 4-epimerase